MKRILICVLFTIILLTFHGCAKKSNNDVMLDNIIKASKLGKQTINLSDLTPFKWDTAYIIRDQTLYGKNFNLFYSEQCDIEALEDDDLCRIVFIKNHKLVYDFQYDTNKIEFPTQMALNNRYCDFILENEDDKIIFRSPEEESSGYVRPKNHVTKKQLSTFVLNYNHLIKIDEIITANQNEGERYHFIFGKDKNNEDKIIILNARLETDKIQLVNTLFSKDVLTKEEAINKAIEDGFKEDSIMIELLYRYDDTMYWIIYGDRGVNEYAPAYYNIESGKRESI